MRTILSGLIVLSVLTGIASTTVNALDPKTYWEQQDRQSH
jgi:hypothetical protein